MFLKRIQLGLIHVALTITLLPINSALNRIMIKELALSATLVSVLASLPYLFSPIQVAIGSFSDRRPLFGLRRTPYVLFGLGLCVAGVTLSPFIAYLLVEDFSLGVLAGLLVFGLWGMGYNLATVSYFSLATELSKEKRRARTVAVMFFMMVVSIIITSIGLSEMLEPYSRAALNASFQLIGLIALGLGVLGVIGLESCSKRQDIIKEERFGWIKMYRAVLQNRQAMLFFRYLILMLVAILGQDILLEPYGAEAFGLSVRETTRITSIWGTFFLISLVAGGALETRVRKVTQAGVGGWSGVAAFALIVISGLLSDLSLFYLGVVLLGLATGLATVSNLSLMLDMTAEGKVGLFIGVWGMANAVSRLVGNVLSGLVRDGVTRLLGSPVGGYLVVFIIEMILLIASLRLLHAINVNRFRARVDEQFSYAERAALAGDS